MTLDARSAAENLPSLTAMKFEKSIENEMKNALLKLYSFFRQRAENQSDDTDMEEAAATEPTVHTHSDASTTQSAAGSTEQYVYQYQLFNMYIFKHK